MLDCVSASTNVKAVITRPGGLPLVEVAGPCTINTIFISGLPSKTYLPLESAAQLVRLLLACRKRTPKDVESRLYQKVKGLIRQRLGIHLPRVLAVPV